MREEVEILDELHGLDGELKSFPAEAHWFCPKRNNDDQVDYAHPDDAEEDMSSETKRELIHDAKRRHSVAYKYSIILGLAPEDTVGMRGPWVSRLNNLLESCDKCGYNWHMGRKAYVREVSEQFDEGIAEELSSRLNELDFRRINAGLEQAQNIIARAEPSLRNQMTIASQNSTALLALFEALCCVDYHRDDEKLSKHFDYVFEQIQSRKVLRISDILPAMTRFLFSTNPVRHAFATTAWQKTITMLTSTTFEWVVQDTLTEVMILVAQSNDTEEIKRFWSGFLLILDKMDESLIRHTLRGMEVQVDIWHLALQHLACNSVTTLPIVMKALHQLLRKAPKDFWSAMGTISPATVAEQIFQSPGFERLLLDPGTFNNQTFESSPATFWITDFLKSLVPIHQHDACRTLLVNLLERFQIERYPEVVRLACCRAGMSALLITLQTFTSSEYKINPTTSLIVINDIMGLVHRYGAMICGFTDVEPSDENIDLTNLAMQVVKEVLTLDCKAVSTEYSALQNQDAHIQRVSRTHSEAIWQSVLDVFRPGNLELAKSVLPATLALVGLDELYPVSKKVALKRDHAEFNKDFHKLMDSIARIFERLSDFQPQSLKILYSDSATARPLVGALVSADEGVNQAAIELIKAMTGQDSKQDAIQYLLESKLPHVLSALTYAAVRIGKASSFGPVPFMIKLNRQVVKALCGNTGVLRARSSFNADERRVVFGWWLGQWKVLDMVFKHTEDWATRVNQPTAVMVDFCRDGMEYAEALFNEYSVFASALTIPNDDDKESLENSKSSSTNESLTNVLKVVCSHVYGLVGLLRLRDVYLISVITSLLGKLLRCLGRFNLEVDIESAEFIKDACKREGEKNFKKTNLTGQQRAELQRALDEHQGVEIIEVPRPSAFPKKQASLDAWSKSADGKQHEPKLPPKSAGAFQLHSNAAEKQQFLQNRINAQKVMSEEHQNAFRENRRKAEEEKNRLKAEAIAKAKALRAPAGVKGEGSGLKDITGLIGKDHAPVRSEIMVGSSDEDSDDDDDEGGIPSLVRKKTSQRVSEYEESKRRALLQQQQGPVKKTKIQRSAKDLRARVEPNMDNLYLEILGWDIFHPGDDPPSNNLCTRIDNKYLDLDKYKKTFAPLLISEIWRSLVTAKDENNFKPVEISVLSRLSVDKFMEVSSTMPISANRDLKMSERDIVLLSKSPDPLGNQQEPHCLARVNRANKKKDVIELTFRVSRDVPQKLLDSCFVPKGKVFAVKIADMTTTQREFAALSSLEYYDLCNEVLEAKPSPLHKYSDEKTAQLSAKYKLNKGQAQAVLSAHDNDGFTLIQGPPGSGKTKTIVAMVGALLTQSLQQQQAELARARPPVQGKSVAPPVPKKKLLICAPSNAAVDELVLRLMDGIQPLSGPRQDINVIRIGRSEAINASVKSVMLDELVRKRLEGSNGENDKLIKDREKLHKDAGQIKERLNVLRPQMDEARGKDKSLEIKLQREFDELKRAQARIGAKIDEEKESGNTVSRQNEINRRKFQQEIIDGAHVLCATLSGSGHDMFRNLNVEFETVIIDEAAQCIELSALIPLKYGCSKCILVGDPEQLPPTVLSRSAQSFGYEQSLFVRMQKNHPKDVHLLDTQYRMHPEISRFPSQQFYDGRLVDGAGMASLRQQPWHASSILGPYRFFDVKGIQTKQAHGHSFINVPELEAAIALYSRLKQDYSNLDFTGKIGIITTYKAQLNELKSRFERKFGEKIFEEIEFNTTDAFQGREREIIIFSCVRAKATGGIGFLGDIRRMNVGLTRAKSSLWVLGDSNALQQGEFWNKLIQDSQNRNRYTGGNVMALLSKPTSRGELPSREAYPTVNGARRPSTSSESIATFSTATLPRRKPSTVDIEMTDAPSLPVSRKSSLSESSSSNETSGGGNRPRDPSLKQEVRRPSVGGSSVGSASRDSSVKQESRRSTPIPGGVVKQDDQKLVKPGSSMGLNLQGKRPRESSKDEGGPAKKENAQPPKNDLAAQLEAQQAAKAARPVARPRPMGGVMPPRKKAPVDPFIQKKRK